LRGEAELLDIQAHKDIYEMVRSGLITECSFAFTIPLDGSGSEWDFDEEGVPPLRTVKKINRLYDVSIVDFPAYDNTEIYARSFERLEDTRKSVEADREKTEALNRRINMKIKLGGIE
jgi:HK97 family phage prohead protease